MKRGILLLALLFLLISPTVLAETSLNLSNSSIPKPSINPWNETIIISPVWQQLVGTFFGLNLHKVSTEVSVRETIVLVSVFVMFLVIILDILKVMPLFKTKILGVSGEFIAALIVTTLVSISGAFINLKNLFIKGVAFTIAKLDWQWLNYLTQNKTTGIIVTILIVIPLIIIIHEILDVIKPILEKYSKISRAETKGRMLNTVLEKEA